MAQQPPPAGSYPPNYGYAPQQPPHQNGNQQPGLVNGGYAPTTNMPPVQKPMAMGIPSQQLPPQQQAINYQKFQTNALQAGAGLNGSNSALSSRTSSPGVQSQPPSSQLPPSRSFPSYQQFQGALPQQAQPPSSQLPMAPVNINNNNINNNGENKNNFTPLSPTNAPMPNMPPLPGMMAAPQSAMQQPASLASSMKNLAINPGQPGSFPTPPMPSSKSEQNFLNNNNMNAPGLPINPSMPQMPMPKPNSTSNLAKRPMYPAQQSAPAPMAQPQQFQQQPGQPQPQGYNNFPGSQMNQQMPQMQQPQMHQQQQQPQQQPRGNLQYQNLQQQSQPVPQQVHQPGSVVQQGFNRMWGNENCDLMQHRHILPPTKVLPPAAKLNHQFHEATNCNADIFRCTLTKIPESNSLLQKSRLPLGILIHPYRDLSVSFS